MSNPPITSFTGAPIINNWTSQLERLERNWPASLCDGFTNIAIGRTGKISRDAFRNNNVFIFTDAPACFRARQNSIVAEKKVILPPLLPPLHRPESSLKVNPTVPVVEINKENARRGLPADGSTSNQQEHLSSQESFSFLDTINVDQLIEKHHQASKMSTFDDVAASTEIGSNHNRSSGRLKSGNSDNSLPFPLSRPFYSSPPTTAMNSTGSGVMAPQMAHTPAAARSPLEQVLVDIEGLKGKMKIVGFDSDEFETLNDRLYELRRKKDSLENSGRQSTFQSNIDSNHQSQSNFRQSNFQPNFESNLQSNFQQNHQSTFQSNPQSSFQLNIDANRQSNVQSNFESNLQSNFQQNHQSNFQQNHQSNFQQNHQLTSQSNPQSSFQSAIDVNLLSNFDSNRQSNFQSNFPCNLEVHPRQLNLQSNLPSSRLFNSLESRQSQFSNRNSSGNVMDKEYLQDVNDKVFGNEKFRTNQLEIIETVLSKRDCFVLMPTGGGKSLCYQLPAVLSDGVTIVISPLIALVEDQVSKLVLNNINAAHFNIDDSSCIYRELESKHPTLKILYVTPEKIQQSERLKSCMSRMYSNGTLSRFVIDEAHCVSQWGHDFRHDYQKLGCLRDIFKDVPIIALTATATERVKTDVIETLQIQNSRVFSQSFNRSNLIFEVRQKTTAENTIKAMVAFIKQNYPTAAGIVYCLSRKECETVAQKLCVAGLSAAHYHAGMSPEDRKHTQGQWRTYNVKIMVATIAFGMGIDQSDVRFVFHYSMPKSIEGYYQEAGRAGRDGKKAHCIIYFGQGDAVKQRQMIRTSKESSEAQKSQNLENVARMVSYCVDSTSCRRTMQLLYFGERFHASQCKGTCDNCRSPNSTVVKDVTPVAVDLINIINQLQSSAKGYQYLIEVYRGVGKGSKNHSFAECGKGKHHDKADLDRILQHMISQNVIREQSRRVQMFSYTFIHIGPANDVLAGRFQLTLPYRVSETADIVNYNDPKDKALFDALSKKREEFSRSEGNSKNVFLSTTNSSIDEMVKNLPRTKEELVKLLNWSNAVGNKYASGFLEVIAEHCGTTNNQNVPLIRIPLDDSAPLISQISNDGQRSRFFGDKENTTAKVSRKRISKTTSKQPTKKRRSTKVIRNVMSID